MDVEDVVDSCVSFNRPIICSCMKLLNLHGRRRMALKRRGEGTITCGARVSQTRTVVITSG